jgi:type I restriction enzyme S subunit
MNYIESVIPKVRFGGFSTPWVIVRLGDIGNFKNGLNKSSEDFGHGFPFINLLDVFGKLEIDNPELSLVNASERDLKSYTVEKGDVFFIRSSVKREGVGETIVANQDLPNTVYSGFLIRYRVSNILNHNFKKYCFWTENFRRLLIRYSTSSANTNINQESLQKLTIAVPELREQQKIADFLSAVDKKISLLKEKHALLKQYKNGVMQKLLKREIRFKDDNGNAFPDWQELKFGDVFERVTRKNKTNNLNVLTISAQRGLINQEKYFNKSVSAKDVTGYYLLENGEFAYNKSYSKGYPMGAIKRLNNYERGVVSTLYICFKTVAGQYDQFWEQYFEAGNLNREISKIAQEGARNHGLLNISVTEFFRDMDILVPDVQEQEQIASFMQVIDKKIDATNEQIELTQTFKKGLLQQMFV